MDKNKARKETGRKREEKVGQTGECMCPQVLLLYLKQYNV